MRSPPARSASRGHLTMIGQIALAVPVAARVLGQLLAPTTPPWRRAVLVVVLAEAVIGAVETVQAPIDGNSRG